MNGRGEATRRALARIVSRRLRGPCRNIWLALVAGYSGLADLSVPAWLLCALLVRPGGRLALVTPATWRSRDYAHVIRYLMLRAFELELVVEDAEPCWFPDALVGTQLIVARRLPDHTTAVPLTARSTWPSAQWVTVKPNAASSSSIVGGIFPDPSPEAAFAKWCRNRNRSSQDGPIASRPFSLQHEWAALRPRAATEPWLAVLEPPPKASITRPFAIMSRSKSDETLAPLPDALCNILPSTFLPGALRSVTDLGIRVGQGLRTGFMAEFQPSELRPLTAPCRWNVLYLGPRLGHETAPAHPIPTPRPSPSHAPVIRTTVPNAAYSDTMISDRRYGTDLLAARRVAFSTSPIPPLGASPSRHHRQPSFRFPAVGH